MKEIGAFEAKNNLSAILRAVEAGETFVITRRGRPVAEIAPPGANRPTPEQLKAEFAALREVLRDEGATLSEDEAVAMIRDIREGRHGMRS